MYSCNYITPQYVPSIAGSLQIVTVSIYYSCYRIIIIITVIIYYNYSYIYILVAWRTRVTDFSTGDR